MVNLSLRPLLVLAFCLASTRAPALSPDPDGRLILSFDLIGAERYLATNNILTELPTPPVIGVEQIAAFEDHEYFAYVYGTSQRGEPHNSELRAAAKPAILRRVYFIRPQLIVIDDQVDAGRASQIHWTLHAPISELRSLDGRGRGRVNAAAETPDQEIRGATGSFSYRCRSLLPQAAEWAVANDDEGRHAASHTIDSPVDEGWIRSVHLVSFANDREPTLPTCLVKRESGGVRLEMVEKNDAPGTVRIIRLWLPDGPASGRIEMVDSGGKELVPNRLLPAGILPPDLNAARRRLQWDLPYQIGGQAVWDIGRPSSALKRLVESGHIKPCRAVEFGSGTGNDAIYLASQGFDVTAIDIAPTALNIAERKAAKAGVKVHWLLADILHPPVLAPYDLVYDRGCYHEVRQHHAKQYVAALKQLTHATSRILILAASANKDSYWRFEGPPRVKEQDIRQDFAPDFRFLHLREFRFDPAPPEEEGALAWSIFLERKR